MLDQLAQFFCDFFGSSFFLDVLSNLIATIIGILIGIPVALRINRYQENKTLFEKLGKILFALAYELQVNFEAIDKWNRDDVKPDLYNTTLFYVSLRTETWNAFTSGGDIQWINEPSLVSILSHSYHQIRKLRELIHNYIDLISGKIEYDEYTDAILLLDLIYLAIEETTTSITNTLNNFNEYLLPKEPKFRIAASMKRFIRKFIR